MTRKTAREKKITMMMGVITAVFLLSVSPYFFFFMSSQDQEQKETTLPTIVIVMYLNSLINPLLYIVINSNIRQATVHLLTCKPQHEHRKNIPEISNTSSEPRSA